MIDSEENTPPRALVGLMRLDEPVPEFPMERDFDNQNTLPWPTCHRNVPGASLDAILSADPQLAQPFIETGRSLKAEGASLIISNCGYTIAFDKLIRENVGGLVATSSLLLLPFIDRLVSASGRIGILTFDASKLSDPHLELAWPAFDRDRLLMSGLEGSRAWHEITTTGVYDRDLLLQDSLFALGKLRDNSSVEAVLVECCALCAFVPAYKAHLKKPVFDAVLMAQTLISASAAEG
ncbi:hypothetical protein [Sinorhizobium mexicanum]|uniref:Uncharacterized protein n=1 Tax=Sinorhizobium mexicanum TaxID=375549 RepID=A0A859QG84_9HYPH|nr:hypothetical protein [Sinorhizobium mexicanum]MBP1885135.1 hypothetical protein [Sinorhizobium mexicanum]QLL64392.1 hypothetical protein FKV68_23475 [Sinorhizobium mexicanum]